MKDNGKIEKLSFLKGKYPNETACFSLSYECETSVSGLACPRELTVLSNVRHDVTVHSLYCDAAVSSGS